MGKEFIIRLWMYIRGYRVGYDVRDGIQGSNWAEVYNKFSDAKRKQHTDYYWYDLRKQIWRVIYRPQNIIHKHPYKNLVQPVEKRELV